MGLTVRYLLFGETLAKTRGKYVYTSVTTSPPYDPHQKALEHLLVTRDYVWHLVATGRFQSRDEGVRVLSRPVSMWLAPAVVNKWGDEDWAIMGPELGRLLYRTWVQNVEFPLEEFVARYKERWGMLEPYLL